MSALPSTLPPSSFTRGKTKLEESDEDIFTVPDMEAKVEETTKTVSQGSVQSNNNGCNNGDGVSPAKRRRGRNPIDKEYRRLKRLLRNRVSAQQARERKKVYVSDLESRAKELQETNLKLQEKISALVNENTMLRKILMNTRAKPDDGDELNLNDLSKT